MKKLNQASQEGIIVDKLLTPEELSDYLNIKESTIYQWTHYRKYPILKLEGF